MYALQFFAYIQFKNQTITITIHSYAGLGLNCKKIIERRENAQISAIKPVKYA